MIVGGWIGRRIRSDIEAKVFVKTRVKVLFQRHLTGCISLTNVVLRIDLFILRIVVKFDQLDFERYSDSAFLGNALARALRVGL